MSGVIGLRLYQVSVVALIAAVVVAVLQVAMLTGAAAEWRPLMLVRVLPVLLLPALVGLGVAAAVALSGRAITSGLRATIVAMAAIQWTVLGLAVVKGS